MKIFTSKQIREIESQAYQEGASEEAFMESAGRGIACEAKDFIQKHHLPQKVLLLCAKGNNSGDAYVAGRYLIEFGCQVFAIQTVPIEACSALCVKNRQRFVQAGGKDIDSLDAFKEGIILDGLFGTGFKGALEEPFAGLVKKANSSSLPIIAIDIPSGLNGDTGKAQGEVIHAQATVFLGAPKKGFFLNEGWRYVGDLRYVDFGLPQKFIDRTPSDMILMTHDMVRSLLPRVKRDWHKYERGYVTGLGGSPDMPGAAILSSWAALVSGAGIVRLIHPQGMEADLAAAPVELVRQTYTVDHLEAVMESINKSSASFIGPGMGRSPSALSTLKYVLKYIHRPCVIDADALTMLAQENIPLPANFILTPHHGEMLRLLGEEKHPFDAEELLKKAQKFIDNKKGTLVLKGSPTFILQAGLPIYVNPRGSPGMATAGSGDVLTGIIAAFLAHHLAPHEAAIVGVYMHALAGESAATAKTPNCMIASDLIKHLPDAYKEINP